MRPRASNPLSNEVEQNKHVNNQGALSHSFIQSDGIKKKTISYWESTAAEYQCGPAGDILYFSQPLQAQQD